jgi:protein-S-isoprenylcysteine O-methyltransferase Ste14
MSDTITDKAASPTGHPVLKHLIQMVVSGLVIAAVLFLAAGRLDWFYGWLYVAVWIASKAAYVLIIGRHDPALIAERARQPADQKPWDRVVLTLYLVFCLATLVVAGLGARRPQHPSIVSVAVGIAGWMVYIAALALATWATAANPFHSRVARIQDDRGQTVATAGPYQYLRHPTYLATVIGWLTTPPILGSWWALIPAAMAGAVMIRRTALEDKMLHEELPGYAEYAQRVRYRLLPGIW